MSTEINPFKAPEARVEDVFPEAGDFIPEGRRVPAGNGMGWLVRGWQHFRKAPGTWIGLSLVFFIVIAVIGMIPIINLLFSIFVPVFAGGIMIGCKAQDEGGELSVGHLFAGFSGHAGSLFLVGFIYLLASFALMAAMLLLGGGTAMLGGQSAIGMGLILIVLVFMLLFIPLAMAAWFAPCLVIFHQMPPFQAMKASLVACLKNILPFLVYGLVATILLIIAVIPLGLGLLVAGPVMQASIYASYRDMFTNSP